MNRDTLERNLKRCERDHRAMIHFFNKYRNDFFGTDGMEMQISKLLFEKHFNAYKQLKACTL